MIMGMCIGCSPYNAEQSVITQAIAVLRRYGSDAHVYLPGVGMLNGLQAGNYLDSAGTTAATVDQPVGLVLDAAGGLGVELVTNAGIAYNASLSSGLIPSTATSNSTLNYGFVQNSFLTPGKRYQVSAAWSGNTLNRKLTFDDGQGLTNTQLQSTAQSGEITSQFTAKAATFFAYASGIASVGESFTVSAISVREVTGIHAQQPTTSAKPILRRGAVNLLTYSNDLTQAQWGKINVSISGEVVTATSANACMLKQTQAAIASEGLTVTGARIVKAGTLTFTTLGCHAEKDVYFDLVNLTATVGSSGVNVPTSTSIIDIGGGYRLCAATWVKSNAIGTIYYAHSNGINNQNVPLGSTLLNVAHGAFQGTYTAAQIQALGGIPTTLTAPVSTALGAYWWDTSGSKSLVATFPAGNESVTVINATPTGQVTTTAQNVVGAYSINTNTNGRIIVKGTLSASDLALLQGFANRLAGL